MAPKAITDKQTLLDLLNDPSVARTESQAQEVFGVKPNVPTAQQELKQSPQTGGSVSDADKLSTPRVTSNPSVTRGGYESARSVDLGGLYNMGGKNATGSFKEYTSTPKAAVVGALDAVEGMAKSPFGMAAGYYANKDTYLSKREAEGSKTLTNQVQERSQQYKKDNEAKNDAKAEKFAKISDSINLYGKDSSIRDFMNRTKEEMQEIKDETGAKFTLADMSYTMGQMAPSIAMGKVGGNLALLNMGVGDVMAATAGLDSVASGILEFGSTLGSIGSMYAQVYGNSFDEARAQGADAKTAADYAQAHAMVEAGTELLGGGIPGMNEGLATKVFSNLAGRTAAKYGGAATGKLLPKVASTIGGILSSPAGEMALDVLGEGVEEMISEVYDPWIAQTTIDPNRPDATFSDVAMAGLTGVMVSAMMQGGVKIFKTAAENGQAYRYNEQTKKIEKPESTSGTTNGESGVVSESSKEAAKDGAPTVSEAVDLENRRSAKAFINAFLTTAAPWARDAFKEGGRLYERYGETINPDMVDRFAVDNNQVGKLLEGDPTWEEIDAFMRDYAIPQIQAAYELSLANEAVDSFKNRIENPTFDNVTPDMISDDYAAQYVSSNPGLNLSLEDAKQRILQEMRGKTGKELSRFAEATGLRDALYGPDFLDIQARARNASRQTKRSNVTSEKYPGRVRVEGKGVLDFRQFADEAAAAMGLKRFEDIPNEKMSKVVEEFEKAVADEKAKIADFVSSLNDRGKATGLKVELSDNLSSAEAGEYDAKTNTLKLNANTIHTLDAFRFFTAHELMHHAFNTLKGTPQLDAFKSYMDSMGATFGRDLAAEREWYKSKPEYKEEWKAEWETYARFFSELLGSPEMMIELAAGNPSMLMDVIGYVDSVNALDKTSNPEVRKAQKAIKADLEMARDGKLEAAEEKKNAPLMKDVPDTVKKASKQKGDKNNTVAEAMQAAVETSPSKSAREAKAKATAETSAPISATEEVFQPKSMTPVEMPEGGEALGFQRAPSSEGGLTFQQVLAGEGKSNQRKLAEAGRALDKATMDITTAAMPGMPNVELRIIDTVRNDGSSVRTIRAVPDDSHALAKNEKNRLLFDWERKKLKQLIFKNVGNGVFEHDFTPEFWNAVKTSDAEAVRAQSGMVDDRDALREYQGKTDGDGAWFSFAVGKDGKEQIRLLFRRNDGSRVRSTTLDKETYKNLEFKYDKDNPNGPGFYAPYSDKLASDLGLPATTKSMRADANRMYNDRRTLFRGDSTVPARNEKYAGFEIGYIPATNTVGLYRDGKLEFIAPYSEAIIDTVLDRTTAPEEIFTEKSKAKERVDSIISGISERYKTKAFPGITENEEQRRNKIAEARAAFEPLSEDEADRIARQENRMENRKDTVRMKFRDSDEWVYLPINTLKQMTTLTSNLNLAGNGLMYDDLYSPEFTPAELSIDPRTGERRRLTEHEIPQYIVDNATGRTIWDASAYDETSAVPGKGISFDKYWFQEAFMRVSEFDAEQDREAKRLAKQNKATEEAFKKAEKKEKAKDRNKASSEKSDVRRANAEAKALEKQADALKSEAAVDSIYNDSVEDEAVTNTEEDRDAAYGGEIDEETYYDNLAQQSPESENEDDATPKRRGWQNMDIFFVSNESSSAFKDAKRRAKLRQEEIEGIKNAEKGVWEDVDLAASTVEQLLTTFRGAERRADLMELLETQRDRAKRQERYDDAAVLDKRLNEVREADAALKAREAEEARRVGDLEEISTRANATEKRRVLQDEARKELDKAKDIQEKLDELLEKEDNKKNRAKRKELQKQIEEANAKAKELNDRADKIGEAVAALDAKREAELAESKREMTDAEKKKLAKRIRKVSKTEEYTVFEPTAEHIYEGGDTTVFLEDDMLDVHPLEQRMRNSNGDLVSPLAEEYYKSKPGSMNDDGQLQLYYADYMDEDNPQLGTGLYTLYTDPNASDYQTEPVYAAIERPLYFDDTIGDSVLTEDTIREALSELGIEDETALNIPRNGGEPMTSLLNGVLQSVDLSQERNLLQALQEVATTVEQNTDAVTGAQVMDELLLQLGYDGVLFPDGAIVFDENLIKSASDTNPANSNNTIGATLGSDFFSKLAEELESLDDILNDDELNRQWDAAREKYGTMNGAPIPNKVSDDGMRVTTSTKNLWINENTNVEGTPLEKANYDMILRGMVDYTPMTDKQALKKVGDWLRKGNTGTVENPDEMTGADFQKKFDSWMDSGDIRSKVSVLQGGQLMAEMANFAREHPEQVTNDMARGWEQLVAKVALGASRTGQILQAYAALKKLTPQGRLGYIQGMVEQLQKELNETKGALRGKLKNVKLTIDQKYIDQINAAKTQEELDKAEDDICKHIAEQIPATLESRVNAYRYLCMLGSARTHVRNIVSNAMMALAKKGAREASGLAQDIFVRSGDKTVSFVDRPTKAMKEFARADAVRQEEALRFGGKQGFQDKINDYRKSFGNSLPGKFLEKLSRLNGGALEKEDWWFLKLEYQTALARYMAAHKDAQGNPLTPEYFNSNTKAALEELNRAREYALNQAWDATYRQSNVVADALNRIEKKSSLASIIIEGLVPFKRTPANILIQGVRYSPIGLLEAVGKAGQMLKNGDVTGAEVADRFGQGLTGTGITILGAWLAAMGFAKASGSDSDREEYYDQMLGNQRYSLHIGDGNYTIDWLTPISMPLMAGVELVEGLKAEAEMDEEEDFSVKFNRLVSAISTMADPVTNLSMLQGINEALSAYKDNQVGALASNAASNYALQFVPTASGQALRTIDPTRRSTYAPSDSKYPFGKFGEEFVNKLKNKSLIANKLLGDNNEYVDMWGRAETGEENRALQAFNQFIAPWYARDYNRTTVDDKLAEVFAANGQNTSVLPATPQSNFSIGGTSYKLSGDDYEKVKKVVGNLSYRGLEDAFNLEEFNELDAETQTSIIKNIYSYAKQIAKIEYAERNGIQVWTSEKDKEAYLKEHPDAKGFVQESYVGKIERLEALGMSAAQYFTIKALSEQYSNKEKKRQFLRTLGLSYEQREVFL